MKCLSFFHFNFFRVTVCIGSVQHRDYTSGRGTSLISETVVCPRGAPVRVMVLCEYELQRDARIKRNKERLQELNLPSVGPNVVPYGSPMRLWAQRSSVAANSDARIKRRSKSHVWLREAGRPCPYGELFARSFSTPSTQVCSDKRRRGSASPSGSAATRSPSSSAGLRDSRTSSPWSILKPS